MAEPKKRSRFSNALDKATTIISAPGMYAGNVIDNLEEWQDSRNLTSKLHQMDEWERRTGTTHPDRVSLTHSTTTPTGTTTNPTTSADQDFIAWSQAEALRRQDATSNDAGNWVARPEDPFARRALEVIARGNNLDDDRFDRLTLDQLLTKGGLTYDQFNQRRELEQIRRSIPTVGDMYTDRGRDMAQIRGSNVTNPVDMAVSQINQTKSSSPTGNVVNPESAPQRPTANVTLDPSWIDKVPAGVVQSLTSSDQDPRVAGQMIARAALRANGISENSGIGEMFVSDVGTNLFTMYQRDMATQPGSPPLDVADGILQYTHYMLESMMNPYQTATNQRVREQQSVGASQYLQQVFYNPSSMVAQIALDSMSSSRDPAETLYYEVFAPNMLSHTRGMQQAVKNNLSADYENYQMAQMTEGYTGSFLDYVRDRSTLLDMFAVQKPKG